MACTCKETSVPSCPQYSEVHEKYKQIFYILRKLTELLECEVSSCKTGRQLELFDHYFRTEPLAHFVNDLPFVCRILELIPEKMSSNELFKEYYQKYLYLSGIPPLMLRSSELMTSPKDLQELFSVLGGLLFYLKDESHRQIVLESLTSLLSRKEQWPPCFVPLQRLKEAAALSLLPKIIGRFLSFAPNELYENVLKVCSLLAESSKNACQQIVEEGAVDSLLIHLVPTSHQKTLEIFPTLISEDEDLHHYEESSILIWILLKSLKGFTEEQMKIFRCPTRHGLWSLRYALKYFICKKKCKVDRNNMVAILLQIVQIFPNTDFVSSGLAQDVIELNLIVESESIPHSDWSVIKIIPCIEDFVFVRLLLMFLPHFNKPEYYGGMQLLRETNIIGSKMKLLTQVQSVKWHRDHQYKLICIVVAVFSQIARDTVEIFLAQKGIIKFMELVLDRDLHIEVHLSMLRSLMIVARLDKIKAGMILNRLLDVKAQFTLMDYCDFVLSKEVLDFKYQLAVGYSFGIIEKLYKRKTTLVNKRLMGLALNFLKRVRKPNVRDDVIVPTLPIMIFSCLWNILLCDEQNLQQFIREEGIYVTLDLAETCVWPVKVTALGLLAEVAEECLAAPFFITWRGTKNQRILPFLLEIFREENQMLGVKHTADGMILDVELPVMGVDQYEDVSNTLNNLDASPAISDMIGSCRSKIYAIFDLLTYAHQEDVAHANEIYKMWNQELSLRDQITKVVAENFFALKIGEVWDELQIHFERCGIRPLANDYEMLSIVLTRARKWGIFLQEKQRDILRAHKETEEIKENIFYMELREARLGQTLAACSELEYIARCTKDLYRVRAKRRQNLHLMEHPVEKTDPNILYHTTFMYDIMVNPVFDQILHIANVNVTEGKQAVPMSPWMRRRMQKMNRPRYTQIPPIPEDELWGSITAETCMNR
ncbi:hypothetical protein HHI36_006482 [Cryptolaemus montrouzieri]|uniref:Cilia- and flagella-associated protein 69 ARM repeats domain-containing protein n=1 Tax=Cryptolaemus montrouzieri TaxID=559131 RepID=A0ABD2NXL4_9CUCU